MTYSRENRSEVQRGQQQTLTLDDSALASQPAGVRVSLWRWVRRYPKWPVILVGSLVLSVLACFLVDGMFLVAVPLALLPNIYYWNRVREHFLHGDANPGIVVSSSPLLIAVWTDMRKEEGSTYPMLRVFEEPPAEEWDGSPAVGTRVATAALYGIGDDEGTPYWESFEPRPVEPVAASAEEARALLESFEPERWERLQAAVAELGTPREGLHRVEVERSSWRETRAGR
jgi:hypothetical protein